MLALTEIVKMPVHRPSEEDPDLFLNKLSVVVDGKIWHFVDFTISDRIVTTHHVRIEIFDLGTSTASQIFTDVPYEDDYKVHSVAANGKFIYVLMCPLDEREMMSKLMKFDTSTLDFEDEYYIEDRVVSGNIHVVDNQLYYLCNTDELILVRFNLHERIRTGSFLMGPGLSREVFIDIKRINGSWYLLELEGSQRRISLVDDHFVRHPAVEDTWNTVSGTDHESASLISFDHSMMSSVYIETADDVMQTELVVESYDHQNQQWIKAASGILHERLCFAHITAVERIEDKLYVLTAADAEFFNEPYAKTYMRILDLTPSLSDICLLNLIKDLPKYRREEIDFEDILKTVPFGAARNRMATLALMHFPDLLNQEQNTQLSEQPSHISTTTIFRT